MVLCNPRNLVDNQPAPRKEGGLGLQYGQGQDILSIERGRHAEETGSGRKSGLWQALPDECWGRIRLAVQAEWHEACPAVDEALDRIRQARANLSGVMCEVRRVLK